MTEKGRWYERHAWCVFFGFGVPFVVYGVYLFLLPHSQPNHWNWLTTDPQVVRYIADHFQWSGALATGFGFFALVTSVMAFRRAHIWAWYVFSPTLEVVAVYIVSASVC